MDDMQESYWRNRPVALCILCLLCGSIKTFAQTDIVTSIMESQRFLLYADGHLNKIYIMSKDGLQTAQVNVSIEEFPVAVDYDPNENVIYWTEKNPPSIKRASLTGADYKVLRRLAPISSPEGIAFDPVAGLLFFTDYGRNTVHVMSHDGRFMKTIVTDAVFPRTIRVDPINRKVFWVDWGTNTIESANYDGTDRQKILISSRHAWVNGLALDLQDKKIYWTDAYNNMIGRMEYQGTRKVAVIEEITATNGSDGSRISWTSDVHYFGVAVDDDYIYYTDWRKSHVTRAIKSDGSQETQLGPKEYHTLYGITLYDKHVYRNGQRSTCNTSNGGCSHLCIPLPEDNAQCECPDGQTMKPGTNNKICKPAFALDQNHQIFWLEHDGLRTGYINSVQGRPEDVLSQTDVVIQTAATPGHAWMAVDYDAANRQLLLSDQRDRAIMTFSMAGDIDIQSVHFGTSGEVYGVAVDWVSGNIYWTDAGYNWIMIAKNEVNTDLWSILVYTDLDQPYAIAVYPEKGMMFWSDVGVADKIESATLAGERRTVIIERDVANPQGLTIDYSSDRLFWTTDDRIESSNLDGGERNIHLMHQSSLFVGLALHEDYFFAPAIPKVGQQEPTSRYTTHPPTLWWIKRNQLNQAHTVELRNKPRGISMFAAEKHVNSDTPCMTTRCEHLCAVEPSVKGLVAKCLCKHGFTMGTGGKCTPNLTPNVPLLIFSAGDRLCSVPLTSLHFTSVQGGTTCSHVSYKYEYHALAFQAQSGTIFYTDYKHDTPTIRKTDVGMKSVSKNIIVVYGPADPEGLAVEYMSDNLYWTSAALNQIWMSRTDGSYQKIVVHDLDKPHGITIDSRRKLMYWTETGKNPRIGKAFLDGTAITTFYHTAGTPKGITFDVITDKIYFVDETNRKIVSVSVDSAMTVHSIPFRTSIVPYDLAVTGDFIAFSDQRRPGAVSVIHKNKNVAPSVIRGLAGERMFDVIAYDKRNQPSHVANRCMDSNGGCEQLCVQGEMGYHCTCVDGMRLASDWKTCVPEPNLLEDNFFLVSDDYRHQIYQLNADFTARTSPPTYRGIKFPPLDRPIPLDYDFRDNYVYWADFYKDIIKRSKLDGSKLQTLKVLDKDSRVDGLTLAPQSRLLYVSDMGKSEIRIMSLDGNYSRVLLHNVTSPRAIALHPEKGRMFFTTRDMSENDLGRAGIWMANMDGSDRTQLDKDGHFQPSGLAIDYEEDMLYWCDGGTEKIQAMKLDGKNRKFDVLRLDPSTDSYSLAVDGGFLYWTDWNKRGIHRVPKDLAGDPLTMNIETFHSDAFTGANEIKIFRRSLQTTPTACSEQNGGCQYFCLPSGIGGRTCVCPEGMEPLPNRPTHCAPTQCANIDVSPGVVIICSDPRTPTECTIRCKKNEDVNFKVTCDRNGNWNAQVDSLCPDPALIAGSTGNQEGNALTMPIIIALGAIGGVILITIIILAVILVRRRSKKKGTPQYRENNNMQAETPVPTVAVVYDVSNTNVQMNGSGPYDNPGYATHDEVAPHRLPEAEQAGPLPEKKPLEDDECSGVFDEINDDDISVNVEGIENPKYYFGDAEGAMAEAKRPTASDLERKPGEKDSPYESLEQYQTKPNSA